MKTLYFECLSGAAGDMLAASLLELIPSKDEFIAKLNALNIPHVEVSAEKTKKCGIEGTSFKVKVRGEEEDGEHVRAHEDGHHHHHHTKLNDIKEIVSGLNINENIKKDIISVYNLLAEAESHVHGEPVSDIHFHEVGSMDALVDITAVCMLIDEISPDRIISSPVCTGSGVVHCAHGVLPVPAPATAFLLKGIPIYYGDIKSELCTPTGAALIKYFSSAFVQLPLMKIDLVGYGMGKKDFEKANCVRALLGEEEDSSEQVVELSCNMDDITGEEVAFATSVLLKSGAKDVYVSQIGMKKGRPGVKLSVICSEEKKSEMVQLIFKHTTTIGIREARYSRYVLDREEVVVDTLYGKIRGKRSFGCGIERIKPEFEDLSRLAIEKNCSIKEIKEAFYKEIKK